MQTNIHLTARELMEKWNTDAIGLYNHIEDGLPAYLGSNRISHRQIRLYDPDFEKWMCRLRFWKRHVELWEEDGLEALGEGTRLRFSSMGDSLLEAPTRKRLLPCEPGTIWRDITITKVADEMVRIKTPKGKGRFTYQHLGLEDGRSPDKPTKLWDLLVALAERSGLIHSENYSFDRTLPSTAKRLNKRLQGIFGIEDSIYTDNYKKEKVYRTKIIFEDETF